MSLSFTAISCSYLKLFSMMFNACSIIAFVLTHKHSPCRIPNADNCVAVIGRVIALSGVIDKLFQLAHDDFSCFVYF